jgi:hypothetical protein
VARASLLSANLLTANAEGGVRASVPAARFRQGRCPDSVLLSARLLTANAEAGVKLQAGELSRFGFLSALLLTLNVEAGVSSAMLLLPLTLPRYSKTGDVAMVSLLSANLHTANPEGRVGNPGRGGLQNLIFETSPTRTVNFRLRVVPDSREILRSWGMLAPISSGALGLLLGPRGREDFRT